MEWLFRKHFCLRKGHSESSFFKSGLAFLEVYFVYSGKGILEIIIVLTESPFQKQQLQSRVAFSEVYFVSSEKGIPEKLYFSLWKNHFGSKNCNPECPFRKVHFVSSKMVVPKVLFLLIKKVFHKIFPFKRVIL